MKFALLDGQIVREDAPHLSLLDSAYLYGIGAFETLRVVKGRTLFVKEHLQRLRHTLQFLRLPLPFQPKEFADGIAKLLKASQLSEAYLRLMVSGEERYLGTGGGTKPMSPLHWSLLVRPFSGYPARLYTEGARLVVIRSVRNDPQPLSQAKVTNYLTKMIARRECAQRKADEGILLNHEGRVVECTSSNLFVVKNGRLITPPLSDGLMPGVTRKVLFQMCRKLKIPYAERSLWPTDLTKGNLPEANEVFITSTLKDVMPVSSVEKTRIGKGCPGPVTEQLMVAYHSLTGVARSNR